MRILRYVPGIVVCLLCITMYSLYAENQSNEVFVNEQFNSKTLRNVLIIPLQSLDVTYENTSFATLEKDFSDSFYIEASNSLILFEGSKQFTCMQGVDPSSLDTWVDSLNQVTCSNLLGDTTELTLCSQLIKAIAQKAGCEFVLFPYSCRIKHVISQKKGFRNQKSTAGPVKYSGETTIHLQIWNKEGELLYEKEGNSTTGSPVLYTLFKRRKIKEDLVSFANHPYTPPLVRSLYQAIISAMTF